MTQTNNGGVFSCSKRTDKLATVKHPPPTMHTVQR